MQAQQEDIALLAQQLAHGLDQIQVADAADAPLGVAPSERQRSLEEVSDELAAKLTRVADLLKDRIGADVAAAIVGAEDLSDVGTTKEEKEEKIEKEVATDGEVDVNDENIDVSQLEQEKTRLARKVDEKLTFLYSLSDMANVGLERKLL